MPEIKRAMEMRVCKTHDLQKHFLRTDSQTWRCAQCSNDAVTKRRRKVKQTLVDEAGGACQICGYNKYVGSLDFHHLDPRTKVFGLSASGMTRSLEQARAEARKCILLCRNCHGEVEAGVTILSSLPGEGA